MHIVPVNQHLYQFQTQNERQDYSGDWNNNILRQRFDHAENASVPRLRCFAHIRGNLSDLSVDALKQTGQVAHDSADQQALEPFCDFVPDKVQRDSPPFGLPPELTGGSMGSAVIKTDRRGAAQQWCRSGQHRHRP